VGDPAWQVKWRRGTEPLAVLEVGGADSWTVPGGTSFGPTAAVEFEPIKNYLMIEARRLLHQLKKAELA
jgi:hypothetical protein